MNRSVMKNGFVTLGTQIINLFLKFVLQRVFITYLGVEYLGYNSVFTNILQMLNMADLGIGVSITSFLYKPLAENDRERIASLMYLYKRIYRIIGLIVLGVGIIIMIILPIIIPDAKCSDQYLRLLFFINMIGVVSTYFLGYKRTLLMAEKKAYFVNIADMLVNFALIGAQIIQLILLPNYLIYLILTIAKNIFSNAIVAMYCDRENRFLPSSVRIEFVESYAKKVYIYVKSVFVSKIGAYIYYGTDNVIISTFLGSIFAGYLSNYSLVTVAIQGIISQVFSALQSNLGDYIAKNDKIDDQKRMANIFLFFNYVIANVCFVGCLFTFQPFILNYVGKIYILKISTVILLSINLFWTLLLNVPAQLFVVYKLFVYDKIIIAISALLNIIISIVLVNSIGINGVLIGTLITSIIYYFSRVYIWINKVLMAGYREYFYKFILWGAASVLSVLIMYCVMQYVLLSGWLEVIVRIIISVFIGSLTPLIVCLKSYEVKGISKYLKIYFINRFNKR